ncbi:TIGR00730 family Rossman fold protein [uncultured Tolumonas sp.]|uniref:LOG family protein n=1 Tax=uncultured Tolumonas sp. TaxID=263765 RepID=UPI00292F4964|nr:TIGR00730 family Rossman fold protein [uncultured Tolumonas sp.]
MELGSICVYCGSSEGRNEAYGTAARSLGRLLAAQGITLVYGGANVGLMRILADSALAAGGRVVGVMPQALVAKEKAHRGLSEFHVADSMHERKALMAELSDGFIALPGGAGTLDELFEMWTWAQLGFHGKPCGLLNVAAYYDPLTAFLDHAVREGFVRDLHRDMLVIAERPEDMLDRFRAYRPPAVEKWIQRNET